MKRLNWAGLLLEAEGFTVMIDPIYRFDSTLFGEPKDTFFPLNNEKRPDAILLTHLHSDHFDPVSIIEAFGKDVPIFVPQGTEEQVKERGLEKVEGLAAKQTMQAGPFTIWAEPAVDGLGDPQVSWVVTDGVDKIFHGGDTLWHGSWWSIAKDHAPFTAAFITINEAVVQDGDMTPSGIPITMSPEQAVAAAKILRATHLVPIHYHSFMNPPRYIEGDHLIERLKNEALKRDQQIRILSIAHIFL